MTSLADEVSGLDWYHTIALPGGVNTRGFYDTLRGLEHVPIPASLEGKRCLDIASCDGFWAFEMERRGASEVVAIDLADPRLGDWPGDRPPERAADLGRSQTAFGIASRALGSSVERHEMSVYELNPERVGSFDFVFIGNVLLHLRDPIGALIAARSVVAGELLSVEAISITATLFSPTVPTAVLSRNQAPWWWVPNAAAYRRYFPAAGYEILDRGRPFFFPFGEGYPERPPLRRLAARPRSAWFWGAIRPRGAFSAWVRARPEPADG